jgi:regulator of protease activity HflC (stomatin/prohibitin superfamily)
VGLFQNAQEDTDILTYMEENTGITMRSLWSIRFVKSLIPAAVIGIVLVLWLATGIVVVDTNQEGAVYRLGKLQEETLKPGLHLTLPWPMDKVEVYDTKSIGTVTIGYVPEGEMDNLWTENHGIEEYRLLLGSGDEMVSINLKIQYRISDLYAYISSSAAPESMLQAKAYEIVTARTISADLEALLATDRQAFSQSFRQELTEKIAPHRTGLEVVDVVLESIHPPVEVADVYQKIISAGIEAEQLVIEAQNKATQKMMTAQAKYTTAVSDALVVKYNSVAEAKASVAEFMASVAADNAYRAEYRFYKYLNALTKYYGKANLILVGDGLDASNLYIGSWNVGSGTLIN